jgi:hypothetical protein
MDIYNIKKNSTWHLLLLGQNWIATIQFNSKYDCFINNYDVSSLYKFVTT